MVLPLFVLQNIFCAPQTILRVTIIFQTKITGLDIAFNTAVGLLGFCLFLVLVLYCSIYKITVCLKLPGWPKRVVVPKWAKKIAIWLTNVAMENDMNVRLLPRGTARSELGNTDV